MFVLRRATLRLVSFNIYGETKRRKKEKERKKVRKSNIIELTSPPPVFDQLFCNGISELIMIPTSLQDTVMCHAIVMNVFFSYSEVIHFTKRQLINTLNKK